MEDIRIRQPGKKDKNQLLNLTRKLYRKSQKEQIAIWEKGYENYLSWTYIAEKEGKIIAYMSLGGDQDSLSIGDLYVLPAFRRKGIASKLIQLAISRQKRSGKRYLSVNARIWNKNSQRLYKKFGFEIKEQKNDRLLTLIRDSKENDN